MKPTVGHEGFKSFAEMGCDRICFAVGAVQNANFIVWYHSVPNYTLKNSGLVQKFGTCLFRKSLSYYGHEIRFMHQSAESCGCAVMLYTVSVLTLVL